MTAILLAIAAGTGVYLLYGSVVLSRRSLLEGRATQAMSSQRNRLNDWLAQAGLANADLRHVGLLVLALFAFGALIGWLFFGGVIAPLLLALFAGSFPLSSYRSRRKRRQAEAAEAWPRMIEEIRLLTGSLGRPIPQALLEVGRAGPDEFRPAFAAAEREWLMSTDFSKTVAVLKEQLADGTADATCETLLVAHTLGGADIDKRLAALAEDRQMDLQGRKDARSKQAGVKFARRFVLVVPVGMALAGMSIGNGRAAYSTPEGQAGVALAILILAACWWWAGRLIRLPEEGRVFRG